MEFEKETLSFSWQKIFFYLKYFYWTLKYFIEMDRVRQPLKRTPKSAPNAAIEGDAWCDQLFRKKGLKFGLFTVPVCLLNNQQLCSPLLTTGQDMLCKATFQSLFFKWLAYNLMPFQKNLYCKCCYVSVYPFLIKMLSKTAGFMYIPIFLLIMVS